MTTSEYTRNAVVEVLRAYLPAALDAAALPAVTVQAIDNENDMKPELLPAVFVDATGWTQNAARSTIGAGKGYQEREYSVRVLFGVVADEGYRDVMTWGLSLADCITAVLETHYRLPTEAVPTGVAAEGHVSECRLTPRLRGSSSNVMRFGELTFAAVVERRRGTHGAE